MAAKKKSAMDKRLTKAQRVLSGYAKSGRKTAQATVDELARLFGNATAAVTGSGRRKTARKSAKRKTTGRKTAGRKTTARKTARRKVATRKTAAGRGRPAIKRAATAKRAVAKRSAPKRAGRPIKRGRKAKR